jgi:hypothetical protein
MAQDPARVHWHRKKRWRALIAATFEPLGAWATKNAPLG